MTIDRETIRLIEDLMITIGLDEQYTQDCIRYIDEGLKTGMVPEKLPKVLYQSAGSMESSAGNRAAWSLIRKMRKKGDDGDCIGRLLTVMLFISEKQFLDASAGYVEDALWRRGCLAIVSQYNIPLSIVWDWFLHNEELNRFNRMPEKHSIIFMDLVAKHRPDLIHNSISELHRSSQLYLAVSLQKYQNERDKTISWFEGEFLKYVEEELLRNPQTTGNATQIVNAILYGEADVIRNLMQHVKWDGEWVNKAVYLAVKTDGEIAVSKLFNRFLILWSPSLFYRLYLYAFWEEREEKLRSLPTLLARYGVTHERYLRLLARNDSFKGLMHEELTRDKDCFMRAIIQSKKLETKHLCLILWETTEDHPYLGLLEEQFLYVVEDILLKRGIDTNDLPRMLDFFRGEPLNDDMKSIFHQYKTPDSSFRPFLSVSENLYQHTEMFNRVICFLGYTDDQTLTYLCIWTMRNGLDCSKFVEVFRNAGGDIKDLLPLLVMTAQPDPYQSNDVAWQEMTFQYLKENLGELSDDLALYLMIQEGDKNDKKTRCFLLELLVKYDQPIYIGLAVKYLADDSKLVRDKSIQLLESCPEQIDNVVKYLIHKKPFIRESAVRLLCRWNTEPSRKALKDLWNREKTEKIKALITNTLQLKLESNSESLLKTANLSREVLAWVEFENLPHVRMKETNTIVDEFIVRSLLYSYTVQEEIMMNWTAHEMASSLQTNDLANLAVEVLQRWLADGAEMKKKWVLTFVAMFGDERVVSSLQSCIQTWPLESRGTIACEAIRALILSPLDSAIVFVDQISRKFKFKQVKQAAIESMGHAAKALGMNPEELADEIVPTWGFDQKGCKRLFYGERYFTIQLLFNHEMQIIDGNGKLYKNLPTALKSDDPEQVRSVQAEYKLLKKQVKAVNQSMRIRLNQAFSNRRKWKYLTWGKLFKDNPLLHTYATGLIWGVYEGDQILRTFRYMGEGGMISFNKQDVELLEADLIGLVHPLELVGDISQQWMEQLRDCELVQPVAQLMRNVFSVSNEDEQPLTITQFGGMQINGLSLLGNISKLGWSKGSIGDGGSYFEFYKENEVTGVGVSLTFSGTSIGCEDEIVTIYDITFYQVGTVHRGNYMYSEIKEINRIKPADVPVYLFSEMMYEVDSVLVKRIGVSEDWRLK
ncbi:hypothetical protein PMSD_19590 [Paenibacillus macquariensis subsp. defensor]|nr:hypothetical protein PMSD_19590 [Paenibacillus macquariensis subsp. defensor]